MDDASGYELEAGSDRPPRKKRYHRHTPRKIQELELNLIHAHLQADLVHPELGLLSTMNNNNNNIYVVFVSSAYQKKAMHTLLASKLTQLHIPSAAVDDPSQDFDFSDLFGPAAAPSPTSASSLFLGDPQVINHSSHSFVGPSPASHSPNRYLNSIETSTSSTILPPMTPAAMMQGTGPLEMEAGAYAMAMGWRRMAGVRWRRRWGLGILRSWVVVRNEVVSLTPHPR